MYKNETKLKCVFFLAEMQYKVVCYIIIKLKIIFTNILFSLLHTRNICVLTFMLNTTCALNVVVIFIL